MVTEEEVEISQEYLIESAERFGQMASEEKYLENRLKVVEALEFRAQDSGAVDAKRMNARASDSYQEVVEKLFEVSVEYQTIRAMREAHKHRISLYQTQQKKEGY